MALPSPGFTSAHPRLASLRYILIINYLLHESSLGWVLPSIANKSIKVMNLLVY